MAGPGFQAHSSVPLESFRTGDAMKNRERAVNFYDLQLRCRFKGLDTKPLPMETGFGLRLAHEAYRSNPSASAQLFSSGQRHITLEDWQFDELRGEHYLVMSCADAELSDVAFKDLRNGKSRMAGKAAHEAVDKSCHLLIRPAAVPSQAALMLQTSGSGVSPDRIASTLSRLLRSASELAANRAHFERSHPSGAEGQKLKLLTTFETSGHQSKSLEQILRTGFIESVELITEAADGIDDADGFQISSKTIRVDVVDSNAGRSMNRFVGLLRAFRREHPNKARVHFKESANGPKKSQLLETNDL